MTVELILGDCLEVMKGMDENSIDTLLTDPPGGIDFMGKQWDDLSDHEAKTERGKLVAEALSSLVNLGIIENWEAGFLLFTVDWASSALRVLKPGAAGLVWSIPRTSDLTQFGLRLAGFHVVDVISHLFGSGFPKSYDIGKGMDKHFGNEREEYQVNIAYPDSDCWGVPNKNSTGTKGMFLDAGKVTANGKVKRSKGDTDWEGWGTALKPAHEDWILVYKPREGTYVENALKWGVAGLWIDGGRVGTDEMQINTYFGRGPFGDSQVGNDYGSKVTQGRFPANVIHDGSDEVLRGFPETGISRGGKTGGGIAFGKENQATSKDDPGFGDSGSAARFFYCAKASRSERNAGLEGMKEKERADINKMMGNDNGGKSMKTGSGNNRNNRLQNHHPTVKPIALMEYLVRLTKTPTGGVVLDPFMGSGTTGIACVNEGRDFIGIEQNEEYLEIARRRIEYWQKRKQPRLL